MTADDMTPQPKVEVVSDSASESGENMADTVPYAPDDACSVWEDYDDSSDEEYLSDDSDCQSSEGSRLQVQVQEAQSEMAKLMRASRCLEQRLSVAVKERQSLQLIRVRLLYRNFAAALLGKLMATNDSDDCTYGRLCLTYLQRLLELQSKDVVTRISKKILTSMKTRLQLQAPHLLHRVKSG
eukprot:CAMPEP_0117681296 /NCGR_PEP_ID=MMETSP0804-20121206/18880_1 /TAXON_ID=1074897 /ORGANISM="Tetraselmis astigmatica, Strain CCMP880" /LENGTH=182 /DNA_ID=CAMNT_0005490991 /DNA_START=336 /DNA_END=881 /DNA_ORIENTATION=-